MHALMKRQNVKIKKEEKDEEEEEVVVVAVAEKRARNMEN